VLMARSHQALNLMYRPRLEGQREQAPPLTRSTARWTAPEQVAEGRTLIRRSAIDAGADLWVGHGPTFPDGVEMYKGKPILQASATSTCRS